MSENTDHIHYNKKNVLNKVNIDFTIDFSHIILNLNIFSEVYLVEKEIIFIKKEGKGYYEEKKSKFIAAVCPVQTEEEALSIIEETRKRYWDARHNCYAFVIGENNELTRCSDDGEPSGTAGKPILEVILGRQLHNCIVIVTRYFGGTLLGTGGLVRAYQKSAIDAIDNAILAKKISGSHIRVVTDYTGLGKIQYLASRENVDIIDTQYAADVFIMLAVPSNCTEYIIKAITEATAGKAVIEEEKDIPLIVEIE